MNNDQLKHIIGQWISINQEIEQLKLQLADKLTVKKHIAEQLKVTMSAKQLDTIDIKKGRIAHHVGQTKKPLSNKRMSQGIYNFFESNQELSADNLIRFLLDFREVKQVDEIVLKPLKDLDDTLPLNS